MPLLSETEKLPVKLLILGDSGTGKSGSLASLALAGYKLRILAYDDGLSVLAAHIRKADPAALANVSAITLADTIKQVGTNQVFAGQPTAFSRGLALCDNWKDGEHDLGKPSEWGTDTVLVIDSLTRMSQAAFNFALALNNSGPFDANMTHYNVAQQLIERFLQKLVAGNLRCNVIVIAHISYWFEATTTVKKMETTTMRTAASADATADTISKAFPMALGRALSPRIMAYFNDAILATKKFTGNGTKEVRYFATRPTTQLDLKSSIVEPPAELSLTTGLLDYFRLCGG